MSQAVKSILYGVVFSSIIFAVALMLVFKAGWYVLVPAHEFAALQASQKLLQTVGDWNQKKRAHIKSKVAKKGTKRIATSAVAGAIPMVATVTAAGVTAYFLIEDHCEDLADNYELEQLLVGGSDKFDAKQCLNEMKGEADVWLIDFKKEGDQSATEVRNWFSNIWSKLRSK